MMKMRRTSLGALVLAVLVIAAPAATSASSKPRPHSCDKRGGQTLIANRELRLYLVGTRDRRLYACRYRGNRNVKVTAVTRTGREIGPVGVNGSKVFWVQQMSARQRQIDRSARIIEVGVWDANAPDDFAVTQMPRPVVWKAAVMNPAGRVVAIADPEGPGSEGRGSEIEACDPLQDRRDGATARGVQTIAVAPAGTISDLTALPNTVIWQQADGTHTAPFEVPAIPRSTT